MCQRLWMQIHRQSRTQPKIYIKRKSILCQHCSNNSIKSAFTAFQRFVDQLVLMENNVGTSYQHYLKGDIHNSLNISNEYTGRYSDAYAINKDLKVIFPNLPLLFIGLKDRENFSKVVKNALLPKIYCNITYFFISIRRYQGNQNLPISELQ